MPLLFPGEGGCHHQRTFRDTLTDTLAPDYGFTPTLRIVDVEVMDWINLPDRTDRMRRFLSTRLQLCA